MRRSERVWQGIPGLERSAGGRLFVAWFTGGTHEPQPENTVVLSYSDNGGHSYSPLQAMALPRDGSRTFDPTLWLDPSQRLWLIFNRGNPTSGLHGVYARICEQPDAVVPEWGEEFRLGFDEVGLSFRMNKPTVLRSGEWVLPVTHAAEKTFEWFAQERQRQGVAISTDQGKSWSLHGELVSPNWALENMIVEKQDGRLWMLIRTGSGFLWESFSEDRGRTWAPAGQSRIANPGSRFFIRRLASGTLLLVNHCRYAATGQWVGRNNLTAQLSVDDGETWNDGLLLDARDDVSYPDGFEGPDGLIRIIYDRDRKGDGDILMATLREEDVAAGRNVSGAVRLRVPVSTLRSVLVGSDPLRERPLLGLGVETEPPPFLFGAEELTVERHERIMEVAERRLSLLRPALVRIFCFPEQWNPSLDGETFTWEDADYLRLIRMLQIHQQNGTRVNLVLFSHFADPTAVQENMVRAMVAMLVHIRKEHGFDHVDWLTLFNEPESIFRQDTPLSRTIFGENRPIHTWDEYVGLNRFAQRLLAENGLAEAILMAMPDSAWGGQMRKERMELTAEAFAGERINFSYHHYNPEDAAFNDRAPAAFHYHGMREEAERFRKLVGPERELMIWEFNNAGLDGFGAHYPGDNAAGENVIEVREAGANLAFRVLCAMQYGVDGLCLWHMHDSQKNRFGLWRSRDEGFVVKPYWHYYALLCHTFRRGQFVLPATETPDAICVLATRDAEGVVRVAVLNNSAQKEAVEIDLPFEGRMREQRVDPEVLPPPAVEVPFCVEREIEVSGRFGLELKPWELVVLGDSHRMGVFADPLHKSGNQG